MPYTAQITGTTRDEYGLNIQVQYVDEEGNIINEVVNTYSAQNENWLSDQIQKRIIELNEDQVQRKELDAYEQSILNSNLAASEMEMDVSTKTMTKYPLQVRAEPMVIEPIVESPLK